MAGGGQRREGKMFAKVSAGCGPENESHYAVSERPALFNPDCKRKMICPSWGSDESEAACFSRCCRMAADARFAIEDPWEMGSS
jgi:hypothetical protein